MNWFDGFVLIILFRTGYVGFRRGLSMELFRFLGLVVSGFAALYYYKSFGNIISLNTGVSGAIAEAVAFLVILICGILISRLIGSATRKIMQLAFAANIDAAGGLVCGLLKGIIIASFTVVLLQQVPSDYINDSIELRSFSGRYLSEISTQVYNLINRMQPEQFQGI